MKILLRCLGAIDKTHEAIGKLVSWLAILLMAEYCWEVILRSAFNSPTNWVYESSSYLFGAIFALGGAYALKAGSMVSVDILPMKLSPKPRAILGIITGIAALAFLAALTYKGTTESIYSLALREVSQSPWAPPVYPLKITIALGSFMLGIQALVALMRNVLTLAGHGKEPA